MSEETENEKEDLPDEEKDGKENSEEEEGSLEEKIEDTEDVIDSEQFEEFMQQPVVESFSPSLERINASQEGSWRVDSGSGFQDFDEKKDEIKYSSHKGSDLKYEHMESHSPERVAFGEIKSPEKILEEQRNIHSQTFVQDSGLLAMKEKQEKEMGYIANPEVRTENRIDNVRKDYLQKS